MNANEVASALLERRLSPNPVIMQGEMLALLGEDGMSEALRQRWLVADNETGFLQISTNEGIIENLRELAAKVEAKEKDIKGASVSEGRNLVLNHAGVKPNIVHELLAPGTGRDSSAPVPSVPSAPTAPVSSEPKKFQIGEDVMVVENGVNYVGKVAKDSDGRYTVSFGDKKPAQPKEYTPEELSPIEAQR